MLPPTQLAVSYQHKQPGQHVKQASSSHEEAWRGAMATADVQQPPNTPLSVGGPWGHDAQRLDPRHCRPQSSRQSRPHSREQQRQQTAASNQQSRAAADADGASGASSQAGVRSTERQVSNLCMPQQLPLHTMHCSCTCAQLQTASSIDAARRAQALYHSIPWLAKCSWACAHWLRNLLQALLPPAYRYTVLLLSHIDVFWNACML